jgi:uncharacterized phage-associated protein
MDLLPTTDISTVSPEVRVQSNTSGDSLQYFGMGVTISALPKPVGKTKINAKNASASVIADLLIAFGQEHGDLFTNLKLQRLLYFAQGWHLGLHGKPLFPEQLQAWPSGPVQPDVYARFSTFGAGPIVPFRTSWEPTKAISKHIQELLEVYGGFSSFDLQRIACAEAPWLVARQGLPTDAPSANVIDMGILKQFYHVKAQAKQ